MTRKATAYDLLRTASRGPAMPCSQEEYYLWTSTWLIPKIIKLVPELKGVAIPQISLKRPATAGDEA